jgi:hypothetical protein
MTAARMVARLAGPLPLGETAGTRAAQVAADARLEETGTLRRTIGAGASGSGSSPLCCAKRRIGWSASAPDGRLFDMVDEYLRKDRPR